MSGGGGVPSLSTSSSPLVESTVITLFGKIVDRNSITVTGSSIVKYFLEILTISGLYSVAVSKTIFDNCQKLCKTIVYAFPCVPMDNAICKSIVELIDDGSGSLKIADRDSYIKSDIDEKKNRPVNNRILIDYVDCDQPVKGNLKPISLMCHFIKEKSYIDVKDQIVTFYFCLLVQVGSTTTPKINKNIEVDDDDVNVEEIYLVCQLGDLLLPSALTKGSNNDIDILRNILEAAGDGSVILHDVALLSFAQNHDNKYFCCKKLVRGTTNRIHLEFVAKVDYVLSSQSFVNLPRINLTFNATIDIIDYQVATVKGGFIYFWNEFDDIVYSTLKLNNNNVPIASGKCFESGTILRSQIDVHKFIKIKLGFKSYPKL